jgi:TonB family protein
MQEAVSEILSGRSREADGLTRMVLFSLAVHAVLVAAVAVMPREWLTAEREPEATPMMISIGGTPGPSNEGMTQMAARRVQEVAPDTKQPFAPPPASKVPEMTVPLPATKPTPKPPAKVEKPAEKSAARKPTTGAEVREGAARVETGGAAVPFGGLSRTGGGGFNATTDFKDFCCPEYLNTVLGLIRDRWNEKQGAVGMVVVKFTIRRDGMLAAVEVEKPSNNPILDLESRRAVLNTQRVPPLPAEFGNPTLTVHLTFEYKR